MQSELLDDTVMVRLAVIVHLDPEDPEMRERLADRSNKDPAEVVAAEVLTNLESVGYVRHVIVSQQPTEEAS